MTVISKLKAVLSLDNSQFKRGLEDAKKQTEGFGSTVGKLGSALAGVFAVQKVLEFSKALSILNNQTKNVERTFSQLNISLSSLRSATGGGIGDLKLQQMAIQARNLGIDVNNLATYFKFAALRAAETGESVDYLVNSIVIGVGRQSRLVLDNLGIGLAELNKEIAKTGDFSTAANNIIQREVQKSVVLIDEAVSGTERLLTAFKNLGESAGQSWFGSGIDMIFRTMADSLNSLIGYEETYSKYAALSTEALRERARILKTFVDNGSLFDYQETANAKELSAVIRVLTQRMDRYADSIDKVRQAGVLWAGQKTPDGEVPWAPGFDPDAEVEQIKQLEELTRLRERFIKLNDKPRTDFANYLGNEATALMGSPVFDYLTGLKDQPSPTSIAPTDDELAALDRYLFSLTEMGKIMNDLATGAVAGLADQIGNLAGELGALMVTGVFNGDALLQSFGGFLQQLGGQMALYGALVLAFGSTQAAMLSDPTPWGKIAEGAALLALGLAVSVAGGAISSLGGGSVSNPSVGSSSGGYGAGGYGSGSMYDYDREIVLVARGEDLVATINRQYYRNGING